jgi:hypothetical protein
MIEDFKKNVEHEKKIMAQINFIQTSLENKELDETERNFYMQSLNALKNQIKIINDSVPKIIDGINFVKKRKMLNENSEVKEQILKQKVKKTQLPKKSNLTRVSYVSPNSNEKNFVTLNDADRHNFLKELSLSETHFDNLRDRRDKKQLDDVVQKPSKLAGYSNRFLFDFSSKIAPKFKDVGLDLKKANMRFMLNTYLSIAIFVSLIVFVSSLFIFTALGILISGFFKWIWIPFALGFGSLIGFYLYPSSEKSNVNKRITDELPFSTIYMSAIAGSNIEPTKIFSIISKSPEYKYVGYEIKKMLGQIQLYGFDLVSSLKNSSKRVSNRQLSELFSGLATNIVTGGSLKAYLGKKSENLLLDYKLRRDQYTQIAETFMDIYISILIAGPLVLMMLFIVMNVSGLGIGLSINAIMMLTIGAVVLANIVFLIVVQIKQPSV